MTVPPAGLSSPRPAIATRARSRPSSGSGALPVAPAELGPEKTPYPV
jgi:hypothetical protein